MSQQCTLLAKKGKGILGCLSKAIASRLREMVMTPFSTLDSFPARFGGVHFVNQPWYIHALYTLIKPFLKDKTRKRIFLHGNNLNSLHQLIHPECLPSEFGGTLPPYDMGTWARTLLGPDYSDENEYTHTSYNAMHVKHASSNLEREASPKPMKSVSLAFTLALTLGSSSKKKMASWSQKEGYYNWYTLMPTGTVLDPKGAIHGDDLCKLNASLTPDSIRPQKLSRVNPGEIPVDWKLANIVLLFKKGRDDPGNYSPVSLTDSKIMEKIILEGIEKQLEDNSGISHSQ
ncbi:hypothetical protein WISP_101072 [Willisornis vidua]|uniref:CRAL-TRIO domain-containing protein n=1 Tax=Willisornis vidua TaxID=1566151 RepID=A0ABQ9CYJ1_9PASS|nr:hypothetical protein WISP_101072 [Willisornis vidua]